MKITVGHLLIVIGAVGVAGLGPLRKMDPGKIMSYVSKLDGQFSSLKKHIPYLKFEGDAAPTPLSNTVVESLPEVSPSKDPVPSAPVEEKKEDLVAANPEAPVETPKVEEAPAVPKPAVRRKRSRRKKVAAPKVEKAVKSTPVVLSAKQGNDPLIGSYVSLMLKSGREIKGVYQQKTATNYVIELPGMGPFEYPISNVQSIQPAE